VNCGLPKASVAKQEMSMLRSSWAAWKAANDNSKIPSRGGSARRAGVDVVVRNPRVPSTETFRVIVRLLPIAGFSAVVLLGVSGAFLIGLAVVGVLAAAVAGFDLVRRHLHRLAGASPWRLERRPIG
jgi:hypothetical protein